jgi:hypothetical protein
MPTLAQVGFLGNFGQDQGWGDDQYIRTFADLNGDSFADLIGYGAQKVTYAYGTIRGLIPTFTEGTGAGNIRDPNLFFNFTVGQGFDVDRHVRLSADFDRFSDFDNYLVAVGEGGVQFARGVHTFTNNINPSVVPFDEIRISASGFYPNFGFEQGWDYTRHELQSTRLVFNDNKDSLIGFGDTGVFALQDNGVNVNPNVALSNPTFSRLSEEFSTATGWTNDNIRAVSDASGKPVDVNGDGRTDILGFGNDGVQVSLQNAFGNFNPSYVALHDLGLNQGWNRENSVRLIADLNNDARTDIVAFGESFTSTYISDGFGFAQSSIATDFSSSQGWNNERHIRTIADLNGDHLADLLAFGDGGTFVRLGEIVGQFKFSDTSTFVPNLGYNQGWRTDEHERQIVDIDGDGNDEIVAMGIPGTFVWDWV